MLIKNSPISIYYNTAWNNNITSNEVLGNKIIVEFICTWVYSLELQDDVYCIVSDWILTYQYWVIGFAMYYISSIQQHHIDVPIYHPHFLKNGSFIYTTQCQINADTVNYLFLAFCATIYHRNNTWLVQCAILIIF